jgi:predicted N-acyltransferase
MTTVRTITSFADVDATAWDALVANANNPFVEHAFLHLLETSGSLGVAWQPRCILVDDDAGTLAAAIPAFSRTDSYGEYIFDWQFAQAATRAGIRYYPKLTVAVPFTPATGPRLLSTSTDPHLRATALDALKTLQTQTSSSSTHVLYCTDAEANELADAGFLRRSSLQFQWRNDGYVDFDDFLSRLSHEARKQIKRERRRVVDSGLVVEVRAGHEVPAAWWPRLYALYAAIYDRKWGRPYLTPEFFSRIGAVLPERAVVVVARDKSRPAEDDIVAMTLSFERGAHCYGRFWGADVDVPGLHFELCYYALLERAIRRRQTLMEAGAQGEHKLKRGYLPVITHSAHRFADDRFHDAVARFFVEEGAAVLAERDELASHGPFKEGAAPNLPLLAGIM